MANDDVGLKLCQQHVIKLDFEIKAVIQDIQGCDGPLEALEELNRDVADKIKAFKSQLEELERFANEQDQETDRTALLKDVDSYRKQLTSMQALLRKANLLSQMAIERKEKELLFEGGTEVRRRRPANKQSAANTTIGVTENLMNLSRMMSSQVTQSEQTMETLVSSSRLVGETEEELKSMGGHIQSSHKLLTKYSRREWTDRLLILLALAFFFASVLYIVKKRLFPSSEDDAVV